MLLKLREKGKSLSYEQFIVAMFSPDGNVDDFIKIIDENKFPDFESAYKFVTENYGVTTKFKTVTKEKRNFEDMENYTKQVFDDFRNNLN